MNNIENIGLKYTVDVNNQIPNNITQKLKNAKDVLIRMAAEIS